MNPPQTFTARADRRGSPRHYLARPLRAELIFGCRRVAIEASRIDDISDHGIGLRAASPIKLVPGTTITVAAAQQDAVWTVSGAVASIRGGIHIGVKVAVAERAALLAALGRHPDSVTVSPPRNGRSHATGTLSMSARHPIQWAVNGGATRLNLAAVTAIDSAGIGLLLLLNERHALSVEGCSPQVCRFIKLCRMQGLCAADCRGASA